MAQIDAFFKLMNDEGASDLHMVAGQQPALRIRGDMERVKFKTFDNEDLKKMLYEICPEEKIKAAMRFQGLPATDVTSSSKSMVSALFSVKFPVTSCPANNWDCPRWSPAWLTCLKGLSW